MFKNAYSNTAYINLITDDLPLISQIKWRIYGQNFTKQDFHKYIDDNIDIIRKMYKDIPFPNVNGREIRTLDDFITNLKDDIIYTQIFK